MTEEQLAEIEARVEAATSGPWELKHGDIGSSLRDPWGEDLIEIYSDGYCGMAFNHTATGTFIAHAREDVPALLAEARRLRTALGALALRGEMTYLSTLHKRWAEFAGSVLDSDTIALPSDPGWNGS